MIIYLKSITQILSSEVSFNLTNEMKLSLPSVGRRYEYRFVTQMGAFPRRPGGETTQPRDNTQA